MNKRKVAHKDVTCLGLQKALTPTHTLDLMGNRTATDIKDPSGVLKRTHRNVYNTLNQLSQSLGADKGPDTQTTHYDEYDANGNLTAVRRNELVRCNKRMCITPSE